MRIFESHAHYDDEQFDPDRDEVIKKIHESGVEKIISAGYSLQGSKNGLDLAKKYDFIYTTLGISPNDIDDNYEQEVEELDKILSMELTNNNINNTTNEQSSDRKLKKSKKIVAIGEIGLDYHYSLE